MSIPKEPEPPENKTNWEANRLVIANEIEPSHTAGEWKVDNHGIVTSDAEDGPDICKLLDDMRDSEWEANGRLIAASPDMLKALQYMVIEAEKLELPIMATLSYAKIAITKATSK